MVVHLGCPFWSQPPKSRFYRSGRRGQHDDGVPRLRRGESPNEHLHGMITKRFGWQLNLDFTCGLAGGRPEDIKEADRSVQLRQGGLRPARRDSSADYSESGEVSIWTRSPPRHSQHDKYRYNATTRARNIMMCVVLQYLEKRQARAVIPEKRRSRFPRL